MSANLPYNKSGYAQPPLHEGCDCFIDFVDRSREFIQLTEGLSIYTVAELLDKIYDKVGLEGLEDYLAEMKQSINA